MNARLLLVTTFGLGHMRPASGTWGSIPPVALAGVLILAGFGPAGSPLVYHAALLCVLVVFSAACILWGQEAELRFGRKDPGQVVADETAGQCLCLLALPAGAVASFWPMAATLAGSFVTFRIMDIIKPPPARGLQRLPAGWGILIDDLLAGVYALVLVQLVARALT